MPGHTNDGGSLRESPRRFHWTRVVAGGCIVLVALTFLKRVPHRADALTTDRNERAFRQAAPPEPADQDPSGLAVKRRALQSVVKVGLHQMVDAMKETKAGSPRTHSRNVVLRADPSVHTHGHVATYGNHGVPKIAERIPLNGSGNASAGLGALQRPIPHSHGLPNHVPTLQLPNQLPIPHSHGLPNHVAPLSSAALLRPFNSSSPLSSRGQIIYCRYPRVADRSKCSGRGYIRVDIKDSNERQTVLGEDNPCMFPSRGTKESIEPEDLGSFGDAMFEALNSRRSPSRCIYKTHGTSVTAAEFLRFRPPRCVDEAADSQAALVKYRSSPPSTPAALAGYRPLLLSLYLAITSDPEFRAIVTRDAGLFVELGVFRGTSLNITSAMLAFLEAEHRGPSNATADGFDTFEGLPEVWVDQVTGIVSAPKGAFSWSKHAGPNGTKTPPVDSRARLHIGLANDTMPPYLAARPGRPLAWLNADFDLYNGTLAALLDLAPRIVRGTRLHFHEIANRPCDSRFQVAGEPVTPSNEALALREFLRQHPCVLLRLEDVSFNANFEQAAIFVVLRGASDC